MGAVDVVLLVLLTVMVLFALFYIVRAKKKGLACIGCPSGRKCGSGGDIGCAACAARRMEIPSSDSDSAEK